MQFGTEIQAIALTNHKTPQPQQGSQRIRKHPKEQPGAAQKNKTNSSRPN